jgi:hypothetical protein
METVEFLDKYRLDELRVSNQQRRLAALEHPSISATIQLPANEMQLCIMQSCATGTTYW